MIAKINKSISSIFSSTVVVCFFVKTAIHYKHKSRATLLRKVTRLFKSPRQPGYLFETRGFPSPSHEGFGFVVGEFEYYKILPLCITYSKQDAKVRMFNKIILYRTVKSNLLFEAISLGRNIVGINTKC